MTRIHVWLCQPPECVPSAQKWLLKKETQDETSLTFRSLQCDRGPGSGRFTVSLFHHCIVFHPLMVPWAGQTGLGRDAGVGFRRCGLGSLGRLPRGLQALRRPRRCLASLLGLSLSLSSSTAGASLPRYGLHSVVSGLLDMGGNGFKRTRSETARLRASPRASPGLRRGTPGAR